MSTGFDDDEEFGVLHHAGCAYDSEDRAIIRRIGYKNDQDSLVLFGIDSLEEAVFTEDSVFSSSVFLTAGAARFIAMALLEAADEVDGSFTALNWSVLSPGDVNGN